MLSVYNQVVDIIPLGTYKTNDIVNMIIDLLLCESKYMYNITE